MTDPSGFWLAVYIVVGIVVWCVLAAVAAFIAPDDRKVTFLLITLLILGPLGVAAAAVAQPRQPVAAGLPVPATPAGRRRFVCPRCGASQNIPDADTSYDCYQCNEHRKVKPKPKPAPKPVKVEKAQASAKSEKAATTETEVDKSAKVQEAKPEVSEVSGGEDSVEADSSGEVSITKAEPATEAVESEAGAEEAETAPKS